MTVEEATDHALYYKNLTWQERFKITMYLNSVAYKLLGATDLKMDKTVFKAKSRN